MLSPEFQDRISEAVTIPTLPETVVRLREALEDPDVSASTIASVAATDPPIAAEVLRLANSAVYAPREPVSSIDQAVGMLGIRTVEGLVLQASLSRQFEQLEESSLFDPKELWVHSILTGLVATQLRQMAVGGNELFRADPYTCGLLHDIGKFVLAANLGGGYFDVLASARERSRKACYEEQEALGFDHAQLGSMVAYTWRFPAEIGNAIEGHHMPRTRLRDQPHVLLIAAANQIANFVTEPPSPERRNPDSELFAMLGVPNSSVRRVLSHAASCLDAIELA